MMPAMRVASILLALFTALITSACTRKPISEIPSISKKRGPDTTDREIPGGQTLLPTLALLDPKGTALSDLTSRRHAFEQKLTTLIPEDKTRLDLGFTSLVSWHELYEKRRLAFERVVGELQRVVRDTFSPGPGRELHIDDKGAVRRCTAGADALVCTPMPGAVQFEGEFRAISDANTDLLEAQAFLLSQLADVTRRLGGDMPGPARDTAAEDVAQTR